jgi:hypothetical protein
MVQLSNALPQNRASEQRGALSDRRIGHCFTGDRFTSIYTFDDDHTDTLRWLIRNNSNGAYGGSEPLLDGGAVGEQAGCAFRSK